MKTNMKKTYTKKQIQEAINYWEKQLKTMNESECTARLIDNEDDCEIDSVECNCEELTGQIEQMMISYGWKGNIRLDAARAANAVKNRSYYSSSDGRFTIEP